MYKEVNNRRLQVCAQTFLLHGKEGTEKENVTGNQRRKSKKMRLKEKRESVWVSWLETEGLWAVALNMWDRHCVYSNIVCKYQ